MGRQGRGLQSFWVRGVSAGCYQSDAGEAEDSEYLPRTGIDEFEVYISLYIFLRPLFAPSLLSISSPVLSHFYISLFAHLHKVSVILRNPVIFFSAFKSPSFQLNFAHNGEKDKVNLASILSLSEEEVEEAMSHVSQLVYS